MAMICTVSPAAAPAEVGRPTTTTVEDAATARASERRVLRKGVSRGHSGTGRRLDGLDGSGTEPRSRVTLRKRLVTKVSCSGPGNQESVTNGFFPFTQRLHWGLTEHPVAPHGVRLVEHRG